MSAARIAGRRRRFPELDRHYAWVVVAARSLVLPVSAGVRRSSAAGRARGTVVPPAPATAA